MVGKTHDCILGLCDVTLIWNRRCFAANGSIGGWLILTWSLTRHSYLALLRRVTYADVVSAFSITKLAVFSHARLTLVRKQKRWSECYLLSSNLSLLSVFLTSFLAIQLPADNHFPHG